MSDVTYRWIDGPYASAEGRDCIDAILMARGLLSNVMDTNALGIIKILL